jgi:mRNA interferase MazF
VLADAGRGDWILCQITSKSYADSSVVVLEGTDFEQGSLQVTSYALPGKLFTASGNLVERVVGVLQPEAVREVIAGVITILRGSALPEPADSGKNRRICAALETEMVGWLRKRRNNQGELSPENPGPRLGPA